MGQAKARREAIQNQATQAAAIDFARVATAVRKTLAATSTTIGMDCYVHANIAQYLLKRLGVQSEIIFGEAAWRLGEGDGDVISHIRKDMKHIIPGAYPYHCWLLVGDKIFDTTTYQLRQKAKQMDELDGQTTTVNWCPKFLLVNQSECSSYERVAKESAGLFFYRSNHDIKLIAQKSIQWDREEWVELAVWSVYETPDVNVIGPNSSNDSLSL